MLNPAKKILPPIRSIKGAAARLFPAGEVLGISEGVENAAAVHELFGLPCWAALSANNLETFDPPREVSTLVIFGDTDRRYVGQGAAYKLAARLANRLGRPDVVEVRLPPTPDSDWLDLLREGAAS